MVGRLATLLVCLTWAQPLFANDPCEPSVKEGPAWRTVSGCLTTHWDDEAPDAGQFPLYFELNEPAAPALGDLIVFHGGPGYPRRTLRETGPLWMGLRSHFRILYFHQRGSGYSARVSTRAEMKGREQFFTLGHLLRDARKLHREVLGGGPVHVMGKSAGGFLAMLFALEYPEVTERVVLAATSAHHAYISERNRIKSEYLDALDNRFPGFQDQRALAADTVSPGLLSALPSFKELLDRVDVLESIAFDLSYTLDGQFETVAIMRDVADGRFELLLERVAAGRKTLRSTGMESLPVLNHITCNEFAFSRSNPNACTTGEAKVLYDLRPRLDQMEHPTLILGGRYDPILPPVFQEEIALALGDNAALHILELSAHMLFQEQPIGSASLILDFLEVPRQQAAQTPAL